MALTFGNQNIVDVKFGDAQVNEIYAGDALVWRKVSPGQNISADNWSFGEKVYEAALPAGSYNVVPKLVRLFDEPDSSITPKLLVIYTSNNSSVDGSVYVYDVFDINPDGSLTQVKSRVAFRTADERISWWAGMRGFNSATPHLRTVYNESCNANGAVEGRLIATFNGETNTLSSVSRTSWSGYYNTFYFYDTDRGIFYNTRSVHNSNITLHSARVENGVLLPTSASATYTKAQMGLTTDWAGVLAIRKVGNDLYLIHCANLSDARQLIVHKVPLNEDGLTFGAKEVVPNTVSVIGSPPAGNAGQAYCFPTYFYDTYSTAQRVYKWKFGINSNGLAVIEAEYVEGATNYTKFNSIPDLDFYATDGMAKYGVCREWENRKVVIYKLAEAGA